MRGLADIALAAVDVFTLEARRAGQPSVNLLRTVALALASVVVLTAGAGFLLAALFLALSPAIGPAAAALFTGCLAVGTGVLGLWSVKPHD